MSLGNDVKLEGKLPLSALPERLSSVTAPFFTEIPNQLRGSLSRSQVLFQFSPFVALYMVINAFLSEFGMLHWENAKLEINKKSNIFFKSVQN